MDFMKRFVLVPVLLLTLALPVAAKLPRLKKTAVPVEIYDTVRAPQLRFSGYDKPNAASRETFLVTNLDSLEINGLAVEFVYFDMEGRQLHRASHRLITDIPAGETRMLSVPSWDRNHAFHYFRSPAPKRRSSTPYRVKSDASYVLRLK